MLPEQAAAMSALGAPRYAMLVLIQTADALVRAWTGVGDLPIEADDVDTDGGTYLGIGLIGDVPALRQLVGGTAERVDFILSGVDDTALALADEDADSVRNAPVNVGIVFFDDDWQMVAAPAWLWDGTADVPSIERDGESRRIGLSVGSAFTDRTRPQLSFYTDADQRQVSPTDTFCKRVAAYSAESTIKWPG